MFLITNILLYVLLLYECSGYISNQFFSYNLDTINSRNSNKNSNNKIYSDFFILPHSSYSIRTNNIYSNFFLSHQFLSHQFLSHQFLSHSLELKTCNNYLSIIDSYSQTKSATIYSISNSNSNSNSISKESIKMFTMIQSYYSQSNSATIYSGSVIILRTIGPTLKPTLKPTLEPTINPSINTKEKEKEKEKEDSSISFTTDLSLSNVQSEYLDLTAQKSIILAQALTMNISSDFVRFVSSSVSKPQNLNKNNMKIKLSSYNLIVTTKTNIILQGKYSVFLSNPQLLFTTLSTSMTNLGIFTHNLVTISLKMNSTVTASAALSSIYIFNPIIQINNTNSSVYVTPTVTHMPSFLFTLKPTTSSKNSGKENYNNSSLIIFVSCISVIVALSILYIVYLFLKRRYIRFLRRNIDKIEIKFCC